MCVGSLAYRKGHGCRPENSNGSGQCGTYQGWWTLPWQPGLVPQVSESFPELWCYTVCDWTLTSLEPVSFPISGSLSVTGGNFQKSSCARARTWSACRWAATAGHPRLAWRGTACTARSCNPAWRWPTTCIRHPEDLNPCRGPTSDSVISFVNAFGCRTMK